MFNKSDINRYDYISKIRARSILEIISLAAVAHNRHVVKVFIDIVVGYRCIRPDMCAVCTAKMKINAIVIVIFYCN